MNLLKIPFEKGKEEKFFLEEKLKFSTKKTGKIKEIRSKLKQKTFNKDQKILRDTCLKLSDFITDEGSFDVPNLNLLLSYIEKSNIIVHKRKVKTLETEKKKLKKRAKK